MTRVLLPALLACALSAHAETNTSAQAGSWHAAATWQRGYPPQSGDTVVVQHDLVITQAVDIGDSTMVRTNTGPALSLTNGSLTVADGAVLTLRGHAELYRALTLEAGTTLRFSTEGAADPELAYYWMKILPAGTNSGRLVTRGTPAAPCRIEALPAHHASIICAASLTTTNVAGLIAASAKDGGQIDAEHARFSGLGDGFYPAWCLRPDSTGALYRLQHCVWSNSGRTFMFNADPKAPLAKPVRVHFEDSRWINSVPQDPAYTYADWSILQTCGSTNLAYTSTLVRCDVDLQAMLWNVNAYEIEDCVFRGGVDTTKAPLLPIRFARNLLRFTLNDRLYSAYGSRLEDSLLIHEIASGNPHYHHTSGGTGTAVLHGCVFWYSSTEVWPDGGDGTFVRNASSGTQDDNQVLIEACLYLPNGRGPDASANLSCNITSGGLQATNVHVVVRRTTAFSQGLSIGETLTTFSGAVRKVASCLFIGSTNLNGTKINDYGQGRTNAVVAAGVDYNAGFRLMQGSNFIATNQTGKGYHLLKLAGDLDIGRHDVDDVDPQFVDPHRTPLTWAAARGGPATMTGAMDLLQPAGTNTVQDLLDYLREGFRPRNPRLKRAGDPADGGPDIGAVNLAADTDGDGIPDDDEFGHPVYRIGIDDRTVDSDDDGAWNADEYVAGTHPGDKTSRFSIDTAPAPDGIRIHFHGVTGRFYEVSFTANLLSNAWQVVSGGLEGADTMLLVEDRGMADEQRYYRGHVIRP
jgi:hypothetical protein